MSVRDITLGETIDFKFTTRSFSTGVPTTSASLAIAAYPGNSTTEITTGITTTFTSGFDARAGLVNVRVNTATGYTTATDYALVVTAGTVGGVSIVGEVVGEFTIGRSAAATRLGLLTATAATGNPGTTTGVVAYLKQLINILIGADGIATFPAEAAPANAVSLAEVIRAIHADVTGLNGAAMRGTDSAGTAAELAKVPKSDGTASWNATALAAINTEADTALTDYDPPTRAELTSDKDEIITDLDDIKGTGFVKDTHSLVDIEAYVDILDDGTSGNAKIATDVAAVLVDTAEIGAAGVGLTEAGGDGDHLSAIPGSSDPWSTALPGAYGAGTAGKIIGDNINAPLATIDTVVDGIQTDLDNGTDGLGAIKADTAAILTDTADIQPNYATSAAQTTAQNDLDIITGATGVNLLAATQASIDAIETDTSTTLQAELDAIQAAVITNAAGADIAADIIAIKAETALIVADTNELQTDDVPGLIATAQTDLDTLTDARGEPAQGAPAASATTNTKIDHLYKSWRNKKDNDGSTTNLYADDATTVDAKQSTSVAGGTVTKDEWVTGP